MKEEGGTGEACLTIGKIDEQLERVAAAESRGDVEFEKRKLQGRGETARDFRGETCVRAGEKQTDILVRFLKVKVEGLGKLLEQTPSLLADVDRLDGAMRRRLEDAGKAIVRHIGIKKIGGDAIVDTDIAQRKSLHGGCVNADDEEVMAQQIPEGRKKITNFTRGR
jgi:hypothetical protein